MTINSISEKNKKKILVVDDSALMRRVMCDIINADERFQVVEQALDGEAAYELLKKNQYDGVVLDVNMPKMNGIQLLNLLQRDRIRARIMMASTDTRDGAEVTLEALELGAIDFVEKPANIAYLKGDDFKAGFLDTLYAVVSSRQTNISIAPTAPVFPASPRVNPGDIILRGDKTGEEKPHEALKPREPISPFRTPRVETPVTRNVNIAKKDFPVATGGQKAVAIASSTGGPKALQSVITKLPAELAAPVLIVQHMPKGFTQSLAERLDSLSHIKVKEGAEGDVLENGVVYIAMGGKHMKVVNKAGKQVITYTDEPPREGVKPCANYMYESLANSSYSQIICVVLTGMGADGTKGIVNLKSSKKIHVIAQDETTSTVYGMPKAVANAGVVDKVASLDNVAQEIIMNVGVK
jgi:two-component system chemotaxis response regulator CheB